MFHAKKLVLTLAVLAATACGVYLGQADAANRDGLSCVMDVAVERRDQNGLVVGTETYHKEFVLQEGGTFSDDFSTPIRFKFFDASLQKEHGETTVSTDWFADVSAFDTVEFHASVTLEDGDKRGKSVGDYTMFTSIGRTTTSYSLTCEEN